MSNEGMKEVPSRGTRAAPIISEVKAVSEQAGRSMRK